MSCCNWEATLLHSFVSCWKLHLDVNICPSLDKQHPLITFFFNLKDANKVCVQGKKSTILPANIKIYKTNLRVQKSGQPVFPSLSFFLQILIRLSGMSKGSLGGDSWDQFQIFLSTLTLQTLCKHSSAMGCSELLCYQSHQCVTPSLRAAIIAQRGPTWKSL